MNNNYIIKDSKSELFLKYYISLLNGEKPFGVGDKNNLFNIFFYSNLKDIYKNSKVKKVIAGTLFPNFFEF